MSWLQKLLPPKIQRVSGPRKQVPEGLWTKCPACSAVLYSTDLEKNLNVCPKCGDHQRIGARARLDGLLDTLPSPATSEHALATLREALSNVARHANATRVGVHLAESETIGLRVEDNGRGIREEEFEAPRSLGFLGLRERVLAFGGSIDVRGEEGKGTTVSVSIPNLVQQPVLHE